jgi:hypothetical protein
METLRNGRCRAHMKEEPQFVDFYSVDKELANNLQTAIIPHEDSVYIEEVVEYETVVENSGHFLKLYELLSCDNDPYDSTMVLSNLILLPRYWYNVLPKFIVQEGNEW